MLLRMMRAGRERLLMHASRTRSTPLECAGLEPVFSSALLQTLMQPRSGAAPAARLLHSRTCVHTDASSLQPAELDAAVRDASSDAHSSADVPHSAPLRLLFNLRNRNSDSESTRQAKLRKLVSSAQAGMLSGGILSSDDRCAYFLAMRDLQLFELAPAFFSAALNQRVESLQRSAGDSQAAGEDPTLFGTEEVDVLLQCMLQAKADAGPDGQPAWLLSLDEAEQLLNRLNQPEMCGVAGLGSAPWRTLMQVYRDRKPPTADGAAAWVTSMRSFYDRIPHKDDDKTHAVMLGTLHQAGMTAEHDALLQQLFSDEAASGVGQAVMTREFIRIRRDIEAALSAASPHAELADVPDIAKLLDEAARRWTAAVSDSAKFLRIGTVQAALSIYASIGDVARQFAFLEEALRLEARLKDASKVLVDAQMISRVIISAANTATPSTFKAQVQRWHSLMLERHRNAKGERKKVLHVSITSARSHRTFMQRVRQEAAGRLPASPANACAASPARSSPPGTSSTEGAEQAASVSAVTQPSQLSTNEAQQQPTLVQRIQSDAFGAAEFPASPRAMNQRAQSRKKEAQVPAPKSPSGKSRRTLLQQMLSDRSAVASTSDSATAAVNQSAKAKKPSAVTSMVEDASDAVAEPASAPKQVKTVPLSAENLPSPSSDAQAKTQFMQNKVQPAQPDYLRSPTALRKSMWRLRNNVSQQLAVLDSALESDSKPTSRPLITPGAIGFLFSGAANSSTPARWTEQVQKWHKFMMDRAEEEEKDRQEKLRAAGVRYNDFIQRLRAAATPPATATPAPVEDASPAQADPSGDEALQTKRQQEVVQAQSDSAISAPAAAATTPGQDVSPLQPLLNRLHTGSADPQQTLEEARAVYSAIDVKNAVTHTHMLAILDAAGEAEERNALLQRLCNDPSTGVIALVMRHEFSRLRQAIAVSLRTAPVGTNLMDMPQAAQLLATAEHRWLQAGNQADRLLNCQAVGEALLVFGRDVARQFAMLEQAQKLESQNPSHPLIDLQSIAQTINFAAKSDNPSLWQKQVDFWHARSIEIANKLHDAHSETSYRAFQAALVRTSGQTKQEQEDVQSQSTSAMPAPAAAVTSPVKGVSSSEALVHEFDRITGAIGSACRRMPSTAERSHVPAVVPLISEADRLWQHACVKPQLLNSAVVGAAVSVFRRAVNIERQFSLLEHARQLELSNPSLVLLNGSLIQRVLTFAAGSESPERWTAQIEQWRSRLPEIEARVVSIRQQEKDAQVSSSRSSGGDAVPSANTADQRARPAAKTTSTRSSSAPPSTRRRHAGASSSRLANSSTSQAETTDAVAGSAQVNAASGNKKRARASSAAPAPALEVASWIPTHPSGAIAEPAILPSPSAQQRSQVRASGSAPPAPVQPVPAKMRAQRHAGIAASMLKATAPES